MRMSEWQSVFIWLALMTIWLALHTMNGWLHQIVVELRKLRD